MIGEMKEKEELVLVGLQRFHGGSVGGGRSLSFHRRFYHLRLFQLILIGGLRRELKKPIRVIAFIDTGVQRTMMDPDILPEEYWKKEVAYFVAADGKIFRTNLVTHAPIGIKFFPDCIIWTKVIGS